MKIRLKIGLGIYLIISLCCTTVPAQPAESNSTNSISPLEKEIVREINLSRTNPQKYSAFVQELNQYYDGKLIKRPGKIPVKTQEGVGATNEAIRFLHSVNPSSAISLSRGMSLGARDHVRDAGPKGIMGHKGSNGSQPWDRVNRYGSWKGEIGEDIFYGDGMAREIVINLIIDDGVPGRGHRKNIFNPDFHVVGVACGYHAAYRNMCVITFAGGYAEKIRPSTLR